MCMVAQVVHLMKIGRKSKVPRSVWGGDRTAVRGELIGQLSSTERCFDITRMGPEAFATFKNILRSTGRLKDTKNSTVEEQLAKFLYVLGHSARNRGLQFFWRRSGETVSRHFHESLKAIVSLYDKLLKQPTGAEVPTEIINSGRFTHFLR